jgi:hypothetical protein
MTQDKEDKTTTGICCETMYSICLRGFLEGSENISCSCSVVGGFEYFLCVSCLCDFFYEVWSGFPCIEEGPGVT